MPGTTPPTPLRIVELSVEELAAHSNELDNLFEKRIDVLVVRGVYRAEDARTVVGRLEAGEGDAWRATLSEKFRFYSLGRCLDMVGPDRRAYHDEAARFRADCRALFRDVPDYEARVGGVLGALGGGRPIDAAPSAEPGGIYMPSTIRFLPDKGYIPPHCELEQLGRQGYDHLAPLVDTTNIISFYVTLATPEAGGEIVIYGLQWHDLDRRHVTSQGRTEVGAIIEQWPSVALRPGDGDLILFDGGRLFHRVAPVAGPRRRWTIGGFVSRRRDHAALWYWS